MTGRFASLLQSRLDRRWILLGLLLFAVIVAAGWALLRPLPMAQHDTPDASGAAVDFAPYWERIEREPHVIDGYRSLSQAYLATGRTEDAVAVWERAEQSNPGQTWPLVELGYVYESSGLLLPARDAFYQAASLNPQDTAANQALARLAAKVADQQAIKSFLATRLPADRVENLEESVKLLPRLLSNGWTFLGYFGELPLELTQDATQDSTLWTFWQAPFDDVKPTLDVNEWQEIAPGIWGREVAVTNLLKNGTFEGALVRDYPDGFPSDLFAAAPITRQVQRLQRDSEFTTVAMLTNDADNPNSSLVSSLLRIPANTVLLASVDIRNEGGNPSMVWTWPAVNTTSEVDWPLPVALQPESAATGVWETYQGIALPPPDTSSVQVQLLNTDTRGAAAFDNVLLAALPAPALMWPAPARQAAAIPTSETAVATLEAIEAAANEESSTDFQTLMARYRAYPAIAQNPSWQAELAAAGPLQPLDQPLASGWTVLGYSTDEDSLAQGESTPLVLYWQGPVGAIAGAAEDGWIALADGKWMQFLPAATNSLEDGTFESGLGAWPDNAYRTPAASRQLAVIRRQGNLTSAGVLINTAGFTATSFVAAPQPIGLNQLYLQAGWLRSDSAVGEIGHEWLGNFNNAEMPFIDYLSAGTINANWKHFAGIAEPPPGAQQVRVHLLNSPVSGAVYFDNILFVPVPAPFPAGNIAQQLDARTRLDEYRANPAVVGDENWLTAVAATGPAHLLDQSLDNGWTFVGFTADEAPLIAGANAQVFYFWQGPLGETPGSPEDGWYSIDSGLWLQIDSASSLLGGQQSLTLPAAQASLPGANTAATSAVEIDSGMLYLPAGMVRSLNGAGARLGVTWQRNDFANQSESTQFITIHMNKMEWTPVAGLLAPPEGANAAQIVLVGEDAGASAEASNLLLLPVLPPASLTSPLAPTP